MWGGGGRRGGGVWGGGGGGGGAGVQVLFVGAVLVINQGDAPTLWVKALMTIRPEKKEKKERKKDRQQRKN